MIKKRTIALLFVAAIGLIIFSDLAYTSNNGKAGYTASPGENACNNCHNTNALNSGGGSVTISSPNMPNWQYFPGNTYTINVIVRKSGLGKFGFGFEALLPSGANGGTISTANSSNAKIISATVLGNSRTNAVHKQPNHFGTDSLVFSFEWTAPAAGTGNITFYTAGNATNSGNNSSGDFIYTDNQLVTEASTLDIQKTLGEKPLLIFPNPSSTGIKFSLPNNLDEQITLMQIFDLNGRLIYAENIAGINYYLNFTDDLKQLNDGIYVVHLQNGQWEHQEKIIVSH